MKNYKDFEKRYIGESDIATLLLSGLDKQCNLVTQYLKFGGDGSYEAYVVQGEAEIGTHYSLVGEFYHWMKIYDDRGLGK